ncbi:MAG: hypothetical protein VX768_18940, partial [Planctomycetota bacterium]|nr:hypothetical protein [Planctomycetota bacterium]
TRVCGRRNDGACRHLASGDLDRLARRSQVDSGDRWKKQLLPTFLAGEPPQFPVPVFPYS